MDDVDARNYTKIYEAGSYQSYPESVDWRTKDAVTSVKDQVEPDSMQSKHYCGRPGVGGWVCSFFKGASTQEEGEM